jgi:membrane protein
VTVDKFKTGLRWIYYFSRFVVNQFLERRGLQAASSLAYTTLLSIVPLVGVMFSFFGNLPVFSEVSVILQEFVFGNFVPEFGRTVQQYLISFSLNASQLTTTGIIVLIIIALMMMATIESAMNHIWNVLSRRNTIARFLVYWTILTLGPVLIGIGLYITSYILALPVISSVDSSLMLKTRLLALMPFVTTTLAFTFMYILVPNCHVNRYNGLLGGLIAALFFELTKYSFGLYVKAVPTYQMIYGALAVIPMFLIWIYLSWLIVLLGSQIAYCLSVFRLDSQGRRRDKQEWDFIDAYKIIVQLWHAQRLGNHLTSAQIKKSGIMIPHLLINQILELLKKANWVHRTGSGRWILTRDMHESTLLDLHNLLPCKFPEEIERSADQYTRALSELVKSHHQDLEQVLDVPLGELFKNGD